jgi:hypothetical protein
VAYVLRKPRPVGPAVDNQEVVMTRDTNTTSKPRRLAALVALLALAGALGGCVVYPAGGYYGGGHHGHYWGHAGWR